MLFFPSASSARDTGDISSAQLARRIGTGDGAALADLYRRDSVRVYRYALAMCGNEATAADVTQDTFIAFARRPSSFDPSKGTLQGYLMGVARHHVLAAIRHTHDPLDALTEEAADTQDPGSLLVAKSDHAALMAAIAQLPVAFREALVLVELQEMSYADAAALAGIELNTLRTRLHRAKKKLAELLGAPTAIGIHV
jgi:RNA polymerase sigma-70 factor (ECF subfamily)